MPLHLTVQEIQTLIRVVEYALVNSNDLEWDKNDIDEAQAIRRELKRYLLEAREHTNNAVRVELEGGGRGDG